MKTPTTLAQLAEMHLCVVCVWLKNEQHLPKTRRALLVSVIANV
jgi:hypothetical protein